MAAAVAVIGALDADVLVLTGVDYDHGHAALAALQDRLAAAGHPYPHRFALPPNTGVATGFDVDGDGRSRGARDAQGWGRFAGAGGMAVLSRLPVDAAGAVDHSAFLWADLPRTLSPDPPELRAVQRLSTTGHWQVPLRLAEGRVLTLLVWAATPPVFDGPGDRNGRRNHDEAAFWQHLIDGELRLPPPAAPFVLIGEAQLDPVDSNGRPAALRALLSHPALSDPAPRGMAARSDAGQGGDPATDTVLYDFGGLRASYVLPSADLRVGGAGVLWPDAGNPLAATLATASRHRPVWVDLFTLSGPDAPRSPAASP
ncbi:MAG: hypothetical protein RIR62_491 [Pseudomonadota bacterium]